MARAASDRRDRGISYAPNLSWLFPEVPFAQRPLRATQAGCSAIEFGFPSHADVGALEAATHDLGIEVVLFNQDVPVWDAANRGYLVDPARKEEFRRTFDEALELCSRLGVRKVMLPAGVTLPETDRQEQRSCMLENLRASAPAAGDAGVVLTLEVLNPVDNPGYFLSTLDEAVEVIDELDDPRVGLQVDTYHLGVLGHDPAAEIRRLGRRIGHVQFADFPGRHEPGSGRLDFPGIRAALDEIGYFGAVGLEYIPAQPGAATLRWIGAESARESS